MNAVGGSKSGGDAGGSLIAGKGPSLNGIIREEDIECDDEPVSSLASIPVDSQLATIKLQEKQQKQQQTTGQGSDLMFSKPLSDLFNLTSTVKGSNA